MFIERLICGDLSIFVENDEEDCTTSCFKDECGISEGDDDVSDILSSY